MSITLLDTLLAQIPLFLTVEQKNSLITYITLLGKWNKIYNLTAIREDPQIIVRHIIDSLVIEPFLQGKYFIDVGSGAGLPGIPCAIYQTKANFTLLDSLKKRFCFLSQVKNVLELTNVQIIHSRVESFRPTNLFDGVLTRGFATLNKMLNLCHHLLGKDGLFYAMKGKIIQEELSNIPNNFLIKQIIALNVPMLDEERHLIIVSPKAQ